jgi:hypothetical protein
MKTEIFETFSKLFEILKFFLEILISNENFEI